MKRKRYDRPLGDRVISHLEDGYGNEGPLARVIGNTLVIGGFTFVFAALAMVVSVIIWSIINLIAHLT